MPYEEESTCILRISRMVVKQTQGSGERIPNIAMVDQTKAEFYIGIEDDNQPVTNIVGNPQLMVIDLAKNNAILLELLKKQKA